MINDLVHGLLEVGDEALWIWSHALIASTLGAQGGSNEEAALVCRIDEPYEWRSRILSMIFLATISVASPL